MKRCIDVDLLKEEIKASRCIMKPQYLIAGEAFEIIESQPIVDVMEVKDLSPCDLCAHNPPSSFDGKPCALCPATKKGEIDNDQ